MADLMRGVGFRLPAGSVSDAVAGYTIDKSVHPFGSDYYQGGPPGSSALAGDAFIDACWRRWGKPPQITDPTAKDFGVPVLPGQIMKGGNTLHRSDFAGALMNVREENPAWFGDGWQAFDGVPTREEVEDAILTSFTGLGMQLLAESRRVAPAGPDAAPKDPWLAVIGQEHWWRADWKHLLEVKGLASKVPTALQMVIEIIRSEGSRADVHDMEHGPAYIPPTFFLALWDQVHGKPAA